jgi:mono/diheme cytochrome c family protein
MSNLMKRKSRRVGRRSPMGLLLLILVWSLAMGWLLALATNAQGAKYASVSSIGTVDVVPARHQLGQQLYLENCATCHIAIPPAVLPSETWKDLLEDPQHYGAQLTPLVDPPRILVWKYLLTFSRSVLTDEQKPYRLSLF